MLAPARRLELLDGLEVVAALRRHEPESDLRADRGRRVSGGLGLLQNRSELRLDCACVLCEAELELGIGQAELPIVDLADVSPRFEVLDGDAQLLGELTERLD